MSLSAGSKYPWYEMPLCVKWYSASNSGLGGFDISLSTLGSSVMICSMSSSSSLEELFISGSSSGIGISNLGRLAVLLVDRI